MIAFLGCPDSTKWSSHLLVDKESKCLKIDTILASKTLWEFSRKEECDTIVHKWQMYFQASEYKGRNFLNLNNNNNQPIHPMYFKDSAWLKHFSFSNLICVCITRLIMNHTSIGKYELRFFPRELFTCTCRNYPIEIRRHILFDCAWYNKSWNPKRKSLNDVLTFLEFNPGAFCFQESIF